MPLWLITALLVVRLLYHPVPPTYEGVVPVYTEVVIGPGRPAVDVRLNLTTSYADLQTGEVRHSMDGVGVECSWGLFRDYTAASPSALARAAQGWN